MLTVTRISPGAGIAYLTQQVATGRHDFRPAGPRSAVAYHADPAAHGEAPGWWAGDSRALFGVEEQVTEKQMLNLIGEGRHPVSRVQLGRLWRHFTAMNDEDRKAAVERQWAGLPADATYEQIAQSWLRVWTAPERHPVAGFDVTVSPVKSVSLLWAFGDDKVKHEVMAAHHDGVRAALQHLREHGAFTRLGTNGIVQVDTDGLAAMVFDHRMSREKDPHLHSHIIVSSKVRITREGREDWLALDSKAFYQATVSARVAYERAVEHQLGRRLGVRFAARDGSSIREIVGFDPRALMHYAKRRAAIQTEMDNRTSDPASRREWIPVGRWRRSAQDATLRTRRPKDGPESTTEAVARWRREDRQAGLDTATAVRQIVTGRFVDHVDRQAQQLIHRAQQHRAGQPVRVDDLHTAAIQAGLDTEQQRHPAVAAAIRRLPHLAVERAVDEVSADRAVFTVDHLELAIGRHLHVDPATDRRTDWRRVQRLAAHAVRTRAGGLRVLTPPALVEWGDTLVRGSDRHSIYSRHRDLKLSTEPVLAAEKELIAYATGRGATLAPAPVLDQVADRLHLSAEKRAALHFAVGDTRQVTGIVGPAGTGKTYLQRAVGIAARHAGVPVLGLTVGQNAAFVLGDATRDGDQPGIRTENIAMWLHAQSRPPQDTSPADWAFQPGQWVIVDEASQASTHDLVRLSQLLAPVGGKLILVGDPEQISAIGPGGMFRYLASLGTTTELREVRRFTDQWEGPASLRLRDGDTTVLAEYDRRGRILAGHRTELVGLVLDGWAADVLQGRTSLILVETERETADIAVQARRLLVRAGLVQAGPTVQLRDGTRAGVGDLVVTRRNNRMLFAGDAFVANRTQWRVVQLGPDGELLVEDTTNETRTALPAAYVAEHVQLAYAATVDSAQGRTVDVARAVIDQATSRARLYVMATRGRLHNILAVVTADEPLEAHPPAPPTAGVTVLAGILRADGTDRSATETEQTLWADADTLRHWAPIYDDLTARAAAHRYVAVIRAVAGPAVAASLATDPALPALAARLESLAAAGYEPEQVLAAAASARELHSARDTATVLAWRIDQAYTDLQPDPSVALAPAQAGTYTQRAPTVDGDIGDALRQVAAICDTRIDALAHQAADHQPAWTTALGPLPDDEPGRRQWTGRAAVIAAYRDRYQVTGDDPIGAEPSTRDVSRWGAWQRAQTVLGIATLAGHIHAATDSQLRTLITAQREADQQAPDYVAGRLRVAHTQLVAAEHHLRDARVDLATAQTTANSATQHAAAVVPRWWQAGPLRTQAALRWQRAATDALRATATVDELRDRFNDARGRVVAARHSVHDLEDQHAVWAAWYAEALPTRYAGLAAAGEATRRAQQLAGSTADLAAAVRETTAKVRAVDGTRPQPHTQPVPDHLAHHAQTAQHRVLDDTEPEREPVMPDADHA
ncbi:MobF family relaxase [Paractinoplanes hotanensis]|uniref:Relaxase domain-containing protein n=1 Tax=Paractinoplanes hotanensis TaxID=2906497 RepID=A0ABT0Y835_9ACTN|nr:MobF family relaxase [Actinoplanes hotanensis]MCM4082198.1 relaxase domain-containing protein [Actinoplanes hotanensis]